MSQVAHIKRFRAEKYRGISGLEIENLSGINLFVGKNGVGKTSLLEAIWLFSGRFDPGLFWNQHIHRTARPILDPLAGICEREIEFRGVEGGEEHVLKAVFEPSPVVTFSKQNGNDPLPVLGRMRIWFDDREMKNWRIAQIQAPDGIRTVEIPNLSPPYGQPSAIIEGTEFSTRIPRDTEGFFSEIVEKGEEESFKKNLRMLLPIIRDVNLVKDPSGATYILATTRENLRLPIESLGAGMVRLFRLFAALFHSRNGIVLIDEIETGLHHSVLPEFWRLLREAGERFNVQVFATTHSVECLDSAIAALWEDEDLLSVHTLYHDSEENRIDAAVFRGEPLKGAYEMNLEIR